MRHVAAALLLTGLWCGPVLGATLALPSVTVTAAVPPPPPPPPLTGGAQIHNAPGWLPNHAYASATGPFTRVNSGPGWSSANGAWNPGQALAAYQLISGACTSGAVMPSGTGASIQDGSCQWRYLSATDYISITGWSSDNKPWAAGAYAYHDVVTSDSPLRAYMQIAASCTSTVKPVGTGTVYSSDGEGSTLGLGSDRCQWVYFADVLYSSLKSYIPTQTYSLDQGTATVHVLVNYTGLLWNDQQYVAGQNGEKSPIEIRNHNSYFGESPSLTGGGGRIILAAAPGEGFASTLKPTDPLLGFDPTKGVSILMNDSYRWPVEPDGLYVENSVDIIGLQIKSLHGSAVGDVNGGSNNHNTIQSSILDGGHTDQWTTPAPVSLDTGSSVSNSLLISHANAGIIFKYPGFVLHSTIVNAEGTGDVGVETGTRWVFNDTTVADTAIFGFAHAGAGGVGTAFSPTSANNVTDAPAGDAGVTTWMGATPPTETVVTIPGTTYGSSAAAAFLNPNDYRPKSGGPLSGKGAAYGPAGLFCAQQTDPNCLTGEFFTFDTPDIVGAPRPQGGSYDVGAWQSTSGGAVIPPAGCVWTGSVAGSCLASTDTTDQVVAPRPTWPGYSDSFGFSSSGGVLTNGSDYGMCDAAFAGAADCTIATKLQVCATPGNVGTNSHPWSTGGVVSWQPTGTVGYDPHNSGTYLPGIPAFSPPITIESTAGSLGSTAGASWNWVSYTTAVCGSNLNSYFVDAVLGDMPNLRAAALSMGSNDTLTVAAQPSGFPFWPTGENPIGPRAGATNPPSNLTITFDPAAKFGYPAPNDKGFLVVGNNGTTINNGTCYWVNPGNNQACIAWDAGLDLTVNGFYGDTAGMGLFRGNFRQGVTTFSNDVFANMGCMDGACSYGHNHNIYLGTVPSGGFDDLIATNLSDPDVLENGWNLKLRTPNSVITQSFFGARVNNGSSSAHGPIDYPCGGTHSVTYSALETNEYSFDTARSNQSSTFLVSADEERSTNCPIKVYVPSSPGFIATIIGPNTFTTSTDPATFAPYSTFTSPNLASLWDLAASGLMVNGPAQIASWTGPVAGVYTVQLSDCFNGEGTIPLAHGGLSIYSCFVASTGTLTLYPAGAPLSVVANTPTTVSISTPVNPSSYGFTVGDPISDSSNDSLVITSITGTGPYTININCGHYSYAGGSNCLFLPNITLVPIGNGPIGTLPANLDVLWKIGPVQLVASTSGPGCDGTNTLCGIPFNPMGLQIAHGEQIIGPNLAAGYGCMVAGQIGNIQPKSGSSGTGHAIGDTMPLVGGAAEVQAVVKVASVGPGGAITGATMVSGGVYTSFVTPTADHKTFVQGASSGAGTGAQFQFPYPTPIVGDGGPYTLRLAQASGAPCINGSATNQVYQTQTPTSITFDHDLIGWDGLCPNGGQCTVLAIANPQPWKSATISNSLVWTDVAAGGPAWGTSGQNSLSFGMIDGGGNIKCNNRTDLATSPRCAIPPFTAASFTGSIADKTLSAPAGATACRPGMFVWDDQGQFNVGQQGYTISGTRIVSGTAPAFGLAIPPGGVVTTDIPSTKLSCGWGTPSSAFDGLISAGGALVINGDLVGSVHVGDYLADVFGVMPDNVKVVSGPPWQTTYRGAGVSAEHMVSVR